MSCLACGSRLFEHNENIVCEGCGESLDRGEMEKPIVNMPILAYHIHELATARGEFTLHPCEGVSVVVNVIPSTWEGVWDTMYLNGKNCGNRAGAIGAFVKMVGEANPQVSWK
jgi:hypothetical protein